MKLQKQHWDPLFAWVKSDFGADLKVADGLSPARQSTDIKAKLRAVVEHMDHWELAGASRGVIFLCATIG